MRVAEKCHPKVSVPLRCARKSPSTETELAGSWAGDAGRAASRGLGPVWVHGSSCPNWSALSG